MNKALHVFVYLFLILTGVAFYYTYEVYKDKEELSDRNNLLRKYIREIVINIEDSSEYKSAAKGPADDENSDSQPYKKDTSPTDAEWSNKYVATEGRPAQRTQDEIQMENVLRGSENWSYDLEKNDHKTKTWNPSTDDKKLRTIYVDSEAAGKVTDGSEADRFLRSIVDACKTQRERLNKTRDALPSLRLVIEDLVKEINGLKPQIRDANATIIARDVTIEDLTGQKTKLESELVERKSEIERLKGDVISLKDEVTSAKEETETAKEELAKEKEMVEKLKKMVQDLQKSIYSQAAVAGNNAGEVGSAVTSVSAGNKGKIIEVDNDAVFAIIEVTPEAMKELKGNDLMRPLPLLEFVVTRPGFKGPAGEIVGRIRLRQEVVGKNWIICDILANWSQDNLKKDDVIIAD